jgi:hypothetical protein
MMSNENRMLPLPRFQRIGPESSTVDAAEM